jgi:hypothetical protein
LISGTFRSDDASAKLELFVVVKHANINSRLAIPTTSIQNPRLFLAQDYTQTLWHPRSHPRLVTLPRCIMPSRKQKQPASASASNENMLALPETCAIVPTKTGEEQTHTPQRSPEKRSVFGITEAQKRALMDNLQLEGKMSQRGAWKCEYIF